MEVVNKGSEIERGAVVIVVYENKEYGVECIETVHDEIPDGVSVVLVDNNSNENIAKYFSDIFPNVHCLRTNRNRGYAGGNNVGAKYAISEGAKYLYILNDDTAVGKDFWDYCKKEISKDSVGIVGSLILEYQSPNIIQEGGTSWNLQRFEREVFAAGSDVNSVSLNSHKECDSICGAGFMITGELFDLLSGFEENFFYLYEESDLSLRAKKAGCRVLTSFDSRIYHKGSATVGELSPMYTFHSVRNHCWFVKRHNLGKISFVNGMIRSFRMAQFYFRKSILNGKLSAAGSSLKGLLYGIFSSP